MTNWFRCISEFNSRPGVAVAGAFFVVAISRWYRGRYLLAGWSAGLVHSSVDLQPPSSMKKLDISLLSCDAGSCPYRHRCVSSILDAWPQTNIEHFRPHLCSVFCSVLLYDELWPENTDTLRYKVIESRDLFTPLGGVHPLLYEHTAPSRDP